MSQSDVRQVDVTLVGGGMSGAVLALSLAALLRSDGSPLEILLLEASVPEQHTHSGFDARAIALERHRDRARPPVGKGMLERIGHQFAQDDA